MSDEPKPTYRVIELQAENVKRLKAVTIRPNGTKVEITGRNGQGKTSVLDALWWALTGGDNIQSSPIRRGEQKAHISLNLGEITVTRKFWPKKDHEGQYSTSLTVETTDGMMAAKPQRFLDDLVDELAMDPLAFAQSKPKDQFEALRQFVPNFDFAAAAAERKRLFEERTEVNRRAAELDTRAKAIVVPEGTPAEPIDEAELIRELEQASSYNTEIQRQAGRREAMKVAVTRKRGDAAGHRRQAEDYERLATEARARAQELDTEAEVEQQALDDLPALPTPVDPTEISAKISHARATNLHVDAARQKQQLAAQAATAEDESRKLSAAIAGIDDEKIKAVAAAKMPVPGLSFGDDIILLNEVPFDQASDAEQLRTSMAIAIATNPRLRVIRIRQGSLLDDDAVGIVTSMAEEAGFQVWIETVSSGRPGAIVIEDGEVLEQQVAE